jgi:hypothetical protein
MPSHKPGRAQYRCEMCSPPAVADVPGTEYVTDSQRRTTLVLDALQRHYMAEHYREPGEHVQRPHTGVEIIGRALTGSAS